MCLHVSEFLPHSTRSFEEASGDSVVLKSLVTEVPKVLDAARAPSTALLYRNAYQRWLAWTREHYIKVSLPVSSHVIILYLIYLSKSATSFSTINLAVSAIAWGHSLAGFISPTRDVLVSECLAGSKFQLAKAKVPKEPFTLAHIHKFQSIMVEGSLTDLRDTCFLVLCFHGFFRFEEAANLKVQDVVYHESHMQIFVRKAKNDQLREGNSVCIAKLKGVFCPVVLLRRYMSRAHIKTLSDSYLFKRVIIQRQGKALHEKNVPITYSAMRSMVQRKAKQIGLDASRFGTHSMRSGGSSAAANSGVSDRVFQRHGRWASVSAKDGYIKDDLKTKLSVTFALQ